MHSSPTRCARARFSGPPKCTLLALGVAFVIGTFVILILMFKSHPIISENQELVMATYTNALRGIRVDWTDPEAQLSRNPTNPVTVNQFQHLLLYRLRVFFVVGETELLQLPSAISSLSHCEYVDHRFPIDVGVHILGNASALPALSWSHGRLDVYAHSPDGNATLKKSAFLADLWNPQSNFELAMFLTPSTQVSPQWFRWVYVALQRYSATDRDSSFQIQRAKNRASGKGLFISPLSEKLSGFALGTPLSGKAVCSNFTTFGEFPSTISIFTAPFWNSIVEPAKSLVHTNAHLESWDIFLKTAMETFGHRKHRFLYPPLGSHGALACETTKKCAIRTFSVEDVQRLVNIPSSVNDVQQWDEQTSC